MDKNVSVLTTVAVVCAALWITVLYKAVEGVKYPMLLLTVVATTRSAEQSCLPAPFHIIASTTD